MADEVTRIVVDDLTDDVQTVELTPLGLQGAPGPEGPQGLTGPEGPQGPAGDTHVPDPATEPDNRWLRTLGGALVYGDAPAGGGEAAAVGAKVYPTTRQVVPWGTVTVLNMDGELWDTDGLHNATDPTRLTLDRAGKWLVVAQVAYTVRATGRRQCRVHVNGALNTHVSLSPVESDAPTIAPVLALIVAAAGDYVEIAAYQDSDADLSVEGGSVFTNASAIYMGG